MKTRIKDITKAHKTSKKKFNLQKAIETLNNQRERERQTLPNKIEKMKVLEQTNIMDRYVQERYESILLPEEKNTIIILVNGVEHGKFWTVKEYEDAHKKHNKFGMNEWGQML